MKISRIARTASRLAALSLLVALPWGAPAQSRSDPQEPAPPARSGGLVEVPPRPDGKSRLQPIAAGDVHLLALIQSLADASAATVVYSGGRQVSEETVMLPKAIDRPDRANLAAALAAAGYTVSEESYRGKKVLWITRLLRPSKRRGAIVRPGEEGPPPAGGEATGDLPPGDGGVRLFVQGEEARPSFLVLFETGSRAEAEEAYKVLLTLRENQRSKRGQEGAPRGATRAKGEVKAEEPRRER